MKKVFVMIAVLLLVVAMPVCAFAGPRVDNELNEDEIKTCFIEPDYYPDYDIAPAPMPVPEKAPKTGDFSLLPQLALAAASVGALAFASKRAT